MKKLIVASLMLALLEGCKPEPITRDEVISNFIISNRTPMADGNTVVYLTVNLNNQADVGKTSVIFETNYGHFQTTANVDTLVTQQASYQADGSLLASIGLKIPATAGTFKVSVRPATTTNIQNYILSDSFTSQPSVPAKITLTPSAFVVKANYGSEINLSAILKNSIGNNVSTGMKVVFQDFYANGLPVSGQFRALKDTTDITSSVSATYTPGAISPNQQITIRCSYVDKTGKITGTNDACLINVQ